MAALVRLYKYVRTYVQYQWNYVLPLKIAITCNIYVHTEEKLHKNKHTYQMALLSKTGAPLLLLQLHTHVGTDIRSIHKYY